MTDAELETCWRTLASDPAPDRASMLEWFETARRTMSWYEARHATVTAQFARQSVFADIDLAEVERRDVRHGELLVQRAQTVEQVASLATALADGAVTSGHVDVLGQVLRRSQPAVATVLLDQVDALVEQAKSQTVEEFRRELGRVAREARSDTDAAEVLARQRKDARVHTKVDPETGMWCMTARLDPVTGIEIAQRLTHTVNELYRLPVPEDCPTHPVEKQGWLRAQALVRMLSSGTAGTDAELTSGIGFELSAVIDLDMPGGPTVDWGVPVEVPRSIVDEYLSTAGSEIHPIVVRTGVVIYAPGTLNLGRTARLANRAQRRALRGLYRTCAVPGCTVPYPITKLHHVIEWDDGGPTDLENLLPICAHHHSRIHTEHWQITLGARRELTITHIDGTIRTTGPPTRRAA